MGVKFSLAKTPSFFQNEWGIEFVNFLAKQNWRGMLPGDGVSHALPLLTRLEGGIKAWTSGKKEKPGKKAAPAKNSVAFDEDASERNTEGTPTSNMASSMLGR